MASRAHERAQKILGMPSEEQLAQLIMRDAAAQGEFTEDHGVLAYARKPIHRERPNERFLLGTIRSVAFANRKAEEDEMWNQRNRRLSAGRDERRQGGMRSDRMDALRQNSRTPEASPSAVSESADEDEEAHDPAQGALTDEELAQIMSKKRIKGRGGIGSRAEEAGPFLPASAAADDDLLEDSRSQHARPAGPERPSWLKRSAETSPDLSGSPAKQKKRLRTEKKHKKGKKHKKDKQHKEKRRRTEEHEAADE